MFARQRPQRTLTVTVYSNDATASVGINYIAHRLGRDRDSDDGSTIAATSRWLVGRVRQLIDKAGFPAPIAPRIRCGEPRFGAGAVDKFAMWEKEAVDDWFDGLLPPPVMLVVDNDRAECWADELDARAMEL